MAGYGSSNAMEIPLSSCMYAVVCSQSTKSLWARALTSLLEKYEAKWPGRVEEVIFVDDLSTVLPRLSELKPTYTCFLTHYSECGKKFVQQVHKITREINPATPYTDTIWGILTGLVEDDCLRILKQEPLTIHRVVGNCPIPLERFTSGVSFSEFKQAISTRKISDGSVLTEACPPDVTETLIQEIGASRSSEEGIDMMITSGHATESELNLGYAFASGQIRSLDGQIYGHSLDGRTHKLVFQENTPKVLSAAGNCLMGHIRDRECMALAWIHSAGVAQMMGYVVPTWYGYAGWGVHKYFINNPGRMTFTEAYFANLQSLLIKLEAVRAPRPVIHSHEDVYRAKFGQDPGDMSSHDFSGLSYDEDTTVLYGDPAWEARLASKPELWDYSLEITKCSSEELNNPGDKWTYWELIMTTLQAGRWDCPTADDKTTCPGRPPVFVFPSRASNAKLITGNAVVTCNFVLMLLHGSFSAGEVHKVQFALQT